MVISAKMESDVASLDETDPARLLVGARFVTLWSREVGQSLRYAGISKLFDRRWDGGARLDDYQRDDGSERRWRDPHGLCQKFISARIVSYQDFISLGGWQAARIAGKVRQEGRDYIMQEGDVVEFMIGS